MYTDSVRSEAPVTSYLGQLYDPYFGTTTGEFVTQVWLLDSLTAINQINVDSVKLSLHFLTLQGDTSAAHHLDISEISNQLYATTDQKYYSNQIPPLTGKSWTNISLPALRHDTVNDIVVTLPNEFGEYLTRDKSKLFVSSDTGRSKHDFRSYFKGLYFQLVSPGNPVFLTLSLAPNNPTVAYVNYITLYIHNDVGTQLAYQFLLKPNRQLASYNLFKHDYSTGDIGKKIEHINDKYPDSLTYAQIMNGVFTRIEIPGLTALKVNPLYKNIGINKARLIIPYVTDNSTFTNTKIPSRLYLRYLNFKGEGVLVDDPGITGFTFYDGTPDTTNHVYNINFATELQRYLEDKKDSITPVLELYVLPTDTYNGVFRANNNPKASAKFEFTYTKF
jgi:hypothetical protein